MQRFGILVPIILLILVLAVPSSADELLTVVADSTLAGQAGYVVHSTSTEDIGSSIFLFEEAGKLRFYASRNHGTQSWDILSTQQYVVPTSTMTIGDTWSFLETDSGEATLARVTALESVTTAAGSFSCYRVVIERVSEPGVVMEIMWFAWGTSFVRSEGYLDGYLDWRDDLQSYSIVGGSGYLPMAVGNTWSYVNMPVAAENMSWSGLKSMFR